MVRRVRKVRRGSLGWESEGERKGWRRVAGEVGGRDDRRVR